MAPVNVIYTPSSSTATPTIGSVGSMAAPARKLYIFKMVNSWKDEGDKEFRCINHPGLPIADLPKFAGIGWSASGNLLDLPVQLHTELAKTIEELNHGVADDSARWMFATAGEYPGIKDGNFAYYAAVVEKNGPSIPAATRAADTPTVLASGDDNAYVPYCGSEHSADDGWANGTTASKSVNDRDDYGDECDGTWCVCGRAWDCVGTCIQERTDDWDAYHDKHDATSCVCGWGCDGACRDEYYYASQGSVNELEDCQDAPDEPHKCECGRSLKWSEGHDNANGHEEDGVSDQEWLEQEGWGVAPQAKW